MGVLHYVTASAIVVDRIIQPTKARMPMDDDDELFVSDDDGVFEFRFGTVPPPQDEVVVDHWHATLARQDAAGDWIGQLTQSPDLAEAWQMYEPFVPSAFSPN
jgi:hypothetical protein